MGDVSGCQQETRCVFRRLRPAEKVPLCLAATEFLDQLELRSVLNSFGHQALVEPSAERDDSLGDHSATTVDGDIAHEGLVDLDRVEQQAPQIAQRRIARSTHRLTPMPSCYAGCPVETGGRSTSSAKGLTRGEPARASLAELLHCHPLVAGSGRSCQCA